MSATEADDVEDVRFQSNYRAIERLHRLIEHADDWAYQARRGWFVVGRLVVTTRSRLEAEQEAAFRLGQWALERGGDSAPRTLYEGRGRLRVV